MLKSFKLISAQAISYFLLIFIGKIIFLFYHHDRFFKLNFTDQIGIFTYGLRLDLSITSYLIIIPILSHIVFHLLPSNIILLAKFNKIYHLLFSFIVSCILVVDLELFRTWGFRIDSTPLKYLSNPKEVFLSAGASPFYILIPILVFLLFLAFVLNRLIFSSYNFYPKKIFLSILAHILVLGLLIIPIRGGLQLAPLNQSSAYFSKNAFANQAAINPVFNLFHSLTKRTTSKNPYSYLSRLRARNIIDSILVKDVNTEIILNTKKPNILIITWESLTSKALDLKFSSVDVLPNFKKLTKEGVYFPNCYASGDRSDKGLVAILSGYPAQPTTSIITIPQKSAKLPIISKDLKKNGYNTSWYYGGEPEFANMKSYIIQGGFDELVTLKNFEDDISESTKWGANDSIVFNRLLKDLNHKKAPFFVNYFTLSSHEPFEISNYQVIKGSDEKSKFLNAHNYTDKQLGDFIEKAKLEPWYSNTLIIIIADHGHRLPQTNQKADEFKIPMLWLGGALNMGGRVEHKVCSQNDLAKTLLNQLGISSKEYLWSKDLFSKSTKPLAYFSFNDGFGLVQDKKWYTFDNTGKMLMQQNGAVTNHDIILGKAYLQSSFEDYLSK